jgi:uncharacterized protein (DUF342 family)
MDRLKDLLKNAGPAGGNGPGDGEDEFEEEFEDEAAAADSDEFEEEDPEGETAVAGSDDDAEEPGIVVHAESVEECLEIAGKKLNAPITELEYEVIERGSPGFFGLGKKPFVFRVIGPEHAEIKSSDSPGGEAFGLGSDLIQALRQVNNTDGTFRVRITKSGVVVKVTAPAGKGRRVTPEEIIQAVKARGVDAVPVAKIRDAVGRADGTYMKVADFAGEPMNDSTASVEIASDEMRAYVRIQPPQQPGGRGLDPEDVIRILTGAGVTDGLKKDAILNALEQELYSQPVDIAEGIQPVNGENARIEYKFRTSAEDIKLTEDEKTGKIDYHNLNLVENVVVGQVLAQKMLATRGIPGRTVTGKAIPATNGKDIPMPLGKNVKVSEDGTKIIADINGQVVITKGLIQVDPVYEVTGDVGLATGNIVFLGSVLVRGNVDDTMSIKAAGNIDIRGSVGNAVLEAEGDIFLRQGLAGRDKAQIVAGHDIYAKFIEHAHLVKAENDVVVSEGLMYCIVRAGKRVVCNGKRAMIVGGEIMAGEEVNAKTIGSQSYTETLIEVGIDPKSREEQTTLEEERRNLKETLREISLNLTTLTEQKRVFKGQLNPEKEEMLVSLTTQRDEKTARLNEIEGRIGQIKTYLDALEEKGKVAVQKTVFPKVKIMVKHAGLEVKDEFNYVSFVQEAGNIKILPYEEAEVKAKEGLGGRRRR